MGGGWVLVHDCMIRSHHVLCRDVSGDGGENCSYHCPGMRIGCDHPMLILQELMFTGPSNLEARRCCAT